MKKLMLICAPVTSRSGYGDHSRDLVFSLIENKNYDVKILDVRWGDCPRNALKKYNTQDKKIIDRILSTGTQIKEQPDVYVDIRIPNEFQQMGKFNIGITAGIETNVVSSEWIRGCNKMDLIIVPSKHSKYGFVNSKYDKLQQNPDNSQQKIGELRLEKPIEVLFEGADENIYKPLKEDEISSEFLNDINKKVKEDFAFLFVGQWTKGGYGEDRKDIGKLIKIFYESFANKKKQPALILKTNGATFSILDREAVLLKIKSMKSMFPSDWKLPNVYLLHGDLKGEEMNYLYNHPKIKGMVSLTHGEGFGRPLLESTMVGLPVITTNWSGHKDFLDERYCVLLGGKLEKVPKSAVWKNIIEKDSQWFVVDDNSTYKMLNNAFENIEFTKANAEELMKINRDKFTLKNMGKLLNEMVDGYISKGSSSPKQVSLNLPKLKKVSDKNPTEIKLPKLKKV